MIRPLRYLVPPLLLLCVVFGRLVARPSWLIADADRPSVDRALPDDALAVGNDLTRLFLPHHARIAAVVNRLGRVPGWDPAGFGGRPLIGNPQAGLWYPPSWLAWTWWTPAALGWLTLAHLCWGAIGVQRLARSVKIPPFAAAIASCCWAANPYVLAQAYEGHYPHLWAASWFPWAFWAAIGLWRGKRRGLFLPPILALSLLTGHAQEGYYLVLCLGLWLTALLIPWRWLPRGLRSTHPAGRRVPRPRRDAILAILAVAGVAILTAGLLAVEIIPDMHTLPYALTGGRLQVREAGKYHVNFQNLMQLLSPRALGQPADYEGPDSYWESMLSVGWVPLVLAAVAVTRSRRRRAVFGWLALAMISVLFAFGPRLGVFRVLFAIAPGMNRFRVPARSLFLASLGAAMLAGYGVEAVARSRKGWRSWLIAFATIAAALALAKLAAPETARSDGDVWLRAGARVATDPVSLLAFIGSALAIFSGCHWSYSTSAFGRPGHRSSTTSGTRTLVAIVLGLLAIVELALYGRALIHVAPPSRFLGPDPVGEAIARVAPTGPFRIRARDAFYGDARAFAVGLEKTNLNDSFQIQHAADLYERLYPMFGTLAPPKIRDRYRLPVQSAVLQRMNVGLLVSDRDDDRFGWPIAERGVWDGVPFTIRKNPDPLPRAYVVPRARVVPDGPATVDLFDRFRERQVVLMARNPLPIDGPRQPFTPAEYVSTDPDRVEIRVTTEFPGLLVVSDTWMPGWTAELDGQSVAVFRGNRGQRVVVVVAPGAHRVVMRYAPPGLALGRKITLSAIIAWAAIAIILAGFSRHRRSIATSRPRSRSTPR